MKTKIFIVIVTALMIAGCDSGSTVSDGNNPSSAQKVVAGWYMRTVAKATLSDGTEYIHQTAGVFGELDESSDEKDRHDIASFKDGILQVVFRPEWDENGGTYFSDYRSHANAQKQVWTFQVKNPRDVNLSDADLTLSVEGLYDVYKVNTHYEEYLSSDKSQKTSLTLVDVDNQREYSYEDLQTANLTMDGLHTRTFRWVLGPVDSSDYDAISTPTPLVAKLEVSTRSAKINAASNPNDQFGLPPSF